MDLNLVRTFCRVAEAESFTAAAKSLGMPKSSASRAVTRLEEQLGTRLLQRNTRHLKLTLTGRVYYETAARAMADLTDAERLVAESQGEPRGTVRLTVPMGVDRGFLSEMVTRFAKEYPAIRVDVSFTNRVVDLVGEGFDLAVRGARTGRLQGSSLIARKVAQLSMGLFASPTYFEGRRMPRRPSDLKNHNFILFGAEAPAKKTWELFGPHGREPMELTTVLASDDFFFIRELVLKGVGLALMVPRIDDLRSGALVRVLPEYEIPDLSIFVVMPSNRHIPRRVALFRDALIESFKTFPMTLDASLASVKPTGT